MKFVIPFWIGSNLAGDVWTLELIYDDGKWFCKRKFNNEIEYELELSNVDEFVDILIDEVPDYDTVTQYIEQLNKMLIRVGFKPIEIDKKKLLCSIVEKLCKDCADCDIITINGKPHDLFKLAKKCGVDCGN